MLILLLLFLNASFAHRVDYVSPICAELAQHADPKSPGYAPIFSFEDLLFFYGLKSTPEAVQFVADLKFEYDPVVVLAAKLVHKDLHHQLTDDSEDSLLFVSATLGLVRELLLQNQSPPDEGTSLHSFYVRHSNLLHALEFVHSDAPVVDALFNSLMLARLVPTKGPEVSALLSLLSLSFEPLVLPKLNPYQIEYLGLEELITLKSKHQALRESLWPKKRFVDSALLSAERLREDPGSPLYRKMFLDHVKRLSDSMVDLNEGLERLKAFREELGFLKSSLAPLVDIASGFKEDPAWVWVQLKLTEIGDRIKSIEKQYTNSGISLTDSEIASSLKLLAAKRQDLITVLNYKGRAKSKRVFSQLAEEVIYSLRSIPLDSD